jgi:ABC-2 type transport system ATP-binding protein
MRRLRLRIEAMAAAGTTFVISSHVMSFVERVCDRVAILKRGALAATGTPDELRAAAGMEGEPFEDVFLKLAL